MTKLDVERGDIHSEPFPHLTLYPALAADDYAALKAAIPPIDRFAHQNAYKAELWGHHGVDALAALPVETERAIAAMRNAVREAAPALVAQFSDALLAKYQWLVGDEIAKEIAQGEWTTTNGRVMARAAGYVLKPHLDSAWYGITCLLYLTDAETKEEGALALYRPERVPDVRAAGTYYPRNAEGIRIKLAKVIPVKENLFVGFVMDRTSVHGVTRDTERAKGWRLAYQCHIVPAGHDVKAITRQRWGGSADIDY
jgi:hypothetical protein